MACLDVELCEKIDVLNSNLETLIASVGTNHQDNLVAYAEFSNFLNYISFFLFLGVVGTATFLIIKWIFNVASDLILGW